MFKKPVVLIALLAAVFVVPVPATASWQFEEAPIPGQTFEVHGQSRFQGLVGGIECTVQAHVALEPGTTTAKAGQFEVKGLSTEKCKGLGGMGGCQVHGVTYSALPLTLHTTETTPATLAITTGNVEYTTTGLFCPFASATVTAGTVTATPDNPNAMKTVTLSGSLTGDLTTKSEVVDKEAVTLAGDLKVTPEGIYGI